MLDFREKIDYIYDHRYMTMESLMITVSAGHFKEQCLKLMDLAHDKREVIVVTKRGVPVARLVPYDDMPVSLFGFMMHTITIKGDLIAPVDDTWEVDS